MYLPCEMALTSMVHRAISQCVQLACEGFRHVVLAFALLPLELMLPALALAAIPLSSECPPDLRMVARLIQVSTMSQYATNLAREICLVSCRESPCVLRGLLRPGASLVRSCQDARECLRTR